jgi:hypothetical protein
MPWTVEGEGRGCGFKVDRMGPVMAGFWVGCELRLKVRETRGGEEVEDEGEEEGGKSW